MSEEILKAEIEMSVDYETYSSLQFRTESTANLYENINKHYLKIKIPGFQPLQTCCPKRNWQKFMRLHSISNNQIYYLVARHCINKQQGRTVVVSSPLQVCFLYFFKLKLSKY